jgi:simple sugar transport system permease protein
VPALAVLTALGLGAIVIVLTDFEHLRDLGSDPLGAIGGAIDLMLRGYGAMLSGALVDPGRVIAAIRSGVPDDIAAAIWPLTEGLVSATPYIFCGLGLTISFRAGLVNLGGDGQFVIGQLGALATAIVLGGRLPPDALLVVALVAGTLSGAIYGSIPGILKARTGAHEVITTLMLNPVASEVLGFAFGVLVVMGSPGPISKVPLVFDLPTIRLDWGFGAALLVAIGVSYLLFRTTLGFQLRGTGFNPTAAGAAGMRPGRAVIIAMALSGGLVGMGGTFLALGPAGGITGAYEIGLLSLAIALVGGRRPGGVVLVALLFGAMNAGAKDMGIVTGIPLALLVVIIAVAMALVAAPSLVRAIWRLPAEERTAG